MIRGFPQEEFAARLNRAQAAMRTEGIAALFLTTEPEIRYFTGFLTRFWESPTRPWFLIVPVSGKPVAVIPSIGAELMAGTWIDDIRTWAAPDLVDDGIGLLAATIAEICPRDAAIGTPMGHGMQTRMPLADYHRLSADIAPRRLVDATALIVGLYARKSAAEIARIAHACTIADRAFARVPEIAAPGTPLARVFRDFQRLLLEEGADWVQYLAGGAGPDGYPDVISPASDRALQAGDILMLDTGAVHDGYFCDFDRNYAIATASPRAEAAHAQLHDATEAGLAACRVGATASDVFHAMAKALNLDAAGNSAGRLGHGLGMRLTEWPSLIAADRTELVDGMVLTLEPGMDVAPGRFMVHEENIVIRETGPQLLSARAPRTLPVIA